MKVARSFLALAFLISVSVRSETLVKGRRSLVFDGKAAQIVIDLGGGSIVDFHLQDLPLNPLVWGNTGDQPALRPMGHFLCLDRWGSPSEAEKRNGMPFHGEATRVEWKVLSEPGQKNGTIHAEMAAVLPLAGLEIQRKIDLQVNTPLFIVSEAVTNRNKLGRVYNMVQHPTIGPPFLDETTVVDSNARKGFMQDSPLPNPEEPAVYWPQALKDGQPVNLRRLTDDPEPNVVSYVLDEEYGWATASNASKGLLIGYIWKVKEYPWFNAWRHVENGHPLARGLEFGTTGLHQPFGILLSKGRIFGRPLYAYLDTSQTERRSFAGFLVRIPKDYHGVGRISYRSGQLILHERGAASERNLTLQAGELFPD